MLVVDLIRSCVIRYRRAGTRYGLRTTTPLFLLSAGETSHARPYECRPILTSVYIFRPRVSFVCTLIGLASYQYQFLGVYC